MWLSNYNILKWKGFFCLFHPKNSFSCSPNIIFVTKKMLNLDDITNENNQDHNKKRLYIPDPPYRMLIIGSSGSGKTYALLNLIKEQDSDNFTDKIYLHAKDLNEQQQKIKKPDDVIIKHLNDPKAFIEYSQCIDDVDNNVNDYNLHRKRKISVAFDDMIADIMTNKINIIEELFIRCRK